MKLIWCFRINAYGRIVDIAPAVAVAIPNVYYTCWAPTKVAHIVYGYSKDVIEPFSDAFVVLGAGRCCLQLFFELLLRRWCWCRCHHHRLNSVVVHSHYLLCIVSAPHCSKRQMVDFWCAFLCIHFVKHYWEWKWISPEKMRHKLLYV